MSAKSGGGSVLDISEELIDAAWRNGSAHPARDSNLWRGDVYGRLMYRHSYSERTDHGWTVEASTLRPQHWLTAHEHTEHETSDFFR